MAQKKSDKGRFTEGHFTFAPKGSQVVVDAQGRVTIVNPKQQKNSKTTKKKKK